MSEGYAPREKASSSRPYLYRGKPMAWTPWWNCILRCQSLCFAIWMVDTLSTKSDSTCLIIHSRVLDANQVS